MESARPRGTTAPISSERRSADRSRKTRTGSSSATKASGRLSRIPLCSTPRRPICAPDSSPATTFASTIRFPRTLAWSASTPFGECLASAPMYARSSRAIRFQPAASARSGSPFCRCIRSRTLPDSPPTTSPPPTTAAITTIRGSPIGIIFLATAIASAPSPPWRLERTSPPITASPSMAESPTSPPSGSRRITRWSGSTFARHPPSSTCASPSGASPISSRTAACNRACLHRIWESLTFPARRWRPVSTLLRLSTSTPSRPSIRTPSVGPPPTTGTYSRMPSTPADATSSTSAASTLTSQSARRPRARRTAT